MSYHYNKGVSSKETAVNVGYETDGKSATVIKPISNMPKEEDPRYSPNSRADIILINEFSAHEVVRDPSNARNSDRDRLGVLLVIVPECTRCDVRAL